MINQIIWIIKFQFLQLKELLSEIKLIKIYLNLVHLNLRILWINNYIFSYLITYIFIIIYNFLIIIIFLVNNKLIIIFNSLK